MQMFTKVKIGGIAVLAALLIIVIIQNTESVETRILFVSLTMPRAVLLFVVFVIGIVTGLLTAFAYGSRNE